ncbi:hypothetical protein PSYPI_31928, partial [Pseudomonas syringae pv. pisi str. 1704B]
MNASGLYGQVFLSLEQHAGIVVEAPLIEGDLFTAVPQAS